MWIDLLLATVLAIAFLVVPGFLVTRSMGSTWEFALCSGPLVTLAAFGVLSVAYGALGVPCGWLTLALPVAAAGALAWALRLRRGSWRPVLRFGERLERPLAESGPLRRLTPLRLALALALAAGAVTSIAVFVLSIGDPNAFEQTYDNAWHLSRIHLFAETQNFSPLNPSLYPSAWHGIAAMVELALGVSTPLAENATNLAFIVGVFPLGSVLLLGTLFPERPRVVWLGGMLCLSFAFFPWRIMLFGPLYPNLAAFSLMPAEAALFIRLCALETTAAARLRSGALFVLGGMSMALAQPNAIFSAGVFLIPYCVWRVRQLTYDRLEGRRHRLVFSIAAAVLLVVAFVSLWVLLAKAPFMDGVVNYPRETRLDLAQAIRWGTGFSFVIRRQQFFIAAVVALGGARLLLCRGKRWLDVSYLLLLGIYVVAISIEGPVRNLIAGFWYSDFYRLAAAVCVFCVPLVAMGMDGVVGAVSWCLRAIVGRLGGSERLAGRLGAASAVLVVSAILALNYVPFEFVEWYYRSYGFDAVAYELRDMYQNPANQALSPEEEAFVERVEDVVSPGEVVYNMPFDGSVFAYAVCDLDVAYDSFGPEGDADLLALQGGLDEIDFDPEVRDAAERAGIRYVLLLDQGYGEDLVGDGSTVYTHGYVKKDWGGVTGVTDETPGLETVLAEGDMRLYRIAE